MDLKNRKFGLKLLTKKKAILELIFAGCLWGFGFVAAVWALEAFTPAEILIYRFLIASVIGELLYLVVRGPNLKSAKSDFLKALPAGAILGGLLLLQTIGLKSTTATKSGFITSLYVILVPLFNSWFLKSAQCWQNFVFALFALFGTFILVDANFNNFNNGDLWTFGCAIFATFHIIYIGKISGKIGNSFRFNNFQSFWSLMILLPLLFFQDSISWKIPNIRVWAGIFSLGLGSSVIAFYIQIRAQKILSDSTASMIFLLESPFAALFGFLLLNERLNSFQILGALIILVASILQILFDPSAKNPPEIISESRPQQDPSPILANVKKDLTT